MQEAQPAEIRHELVIVSNHEEVSTFRGEGESRRNCFSSPSSLNDICEFRNFAFCNFLRQITFYLVIVSDFLTCMGKIIILWKMHMWDLHQSGSPSVSVSESMHGNNIRSRFRPRDRPVCGEHAQTDKLQQQQFPRIRSSENRVMCQNFPAGRHELEKLQKT